MTKVLGLRVDVDFGIGLQRGVPYLLDAFRRRNIRATFYITMGPDGFRKHTRRLGSSRYRNRVRRMSPWAVMWKFGPAYLARQAAGLPDKVGQRNPRMVRRVLDEGHEVGVHGYDHYWWAENVYTSDRIGLQHDMDLAFDAFRDCVGREAATWASPNWRCSTDSLRLVDERRLPYGADTRGHSPFLPAIAGWVGLTPQVPISLPCLHEIADFQNTSDPGAIARAFGDALTGEYDVWCVHDYYEGLLRRELFERVLDAALDGGWSVVPIEAIARQIDRTKLDTCEVVQETVPGGRGRVSCQGDRVATSPRP